MRASGVWAGASACAMCWDGLQGIPGSDAKTWCPPWGDFEAGTGQRRAFGGGCERVSSQLGQSKGEGQAGGSSALPSSWAPSRIPFPWGYPGLSATRPCKFVMGTILTGGMRPTRVHGLRVIACAEGFPTSGKGEQEEGSTDHCHLGHFSFLASLCPKMRSEKKWEKK